MNYAKIRKMDISNGPGVRVSIFVSGCNNNCKGCFNKEAQDFNYGNLYTKEVESKIVDYLKSDYIQGLSILGGEPFEFKNQETVLNLINRVKKAFPEKNIWIWSGFTIENLLSRKDKITNEILKKIDVLVDGPFIENLKDPKLQFRGSSNQRIINIKEYIKDMKKTFRNLNDVEYINNGDWADPEVKYRGYTFNYYDLEERLEQIYNEDISNSNNKIPFDQYLKENPEVIYNELQDLIDNYWETKLQETPFKEIEACKEKINDLNIFNQSLLYQIKAIEETYEGVYILDYFKLKELSSMSEDETYEYLMKTCFELGEDNQWLEEIKQFPKQIEEEFENYTINLEKIKAGNPVFTEKDLDESINIKLKNDLYLSFWHSSNGEGIYYEIRDSKGIEIDGEIQLYGLVNTQDEILQEDLINSLLNMSGYPSQEEFERLPNGDLEDILNEDEDLEQ